MKSCIYWMRQSLNEDCLRPDLVVYHDANGWFKTDQGFREYQANALIAAGVAGTSAENWFVPDLEPSEAGNSSVGEWDYYMCGATMGVFSKRAIEILKPCFEKRFTVLPVMLSGIAYFTLRCEERIDCLDQSESVLEWFEKNVTIMSVKKLVFRKESFSDSGCCIFAIPELPCELFCNESTKALIETSNLQGFELQLAEEWDDVIK